MSQRSHGPLWVNRVLSTIEHVTPSWVKHVSPAYCHNTRMGLWVGVRHPLIIWPVWRHILGGPMRVSSHTNRVRSRTAVGVGGPVRSARKATFWDAPVTIRPWGVMGRL
jgi:hypothetical protein